VTDKVLVISNCGSDDEAARLAGSLVEAKLAACVNILPPIKSVYRWKGVVETAEEWMVLIKTRRELVPRLAEEIRRIHSYELPEVVAIPIVDGLADYLAWIDRETNGG
jgi:periplasmic divalent cation tolerance protein